jgi:hypothetical protein
MRLLALPSSCSFRTPSQDITLTPRLALGLLIAITFVLHLIWGAIFPPTNDETYHYLYTTHPSLSYFDHPPMTMWVAKAGILLCGGSVHPLSLRLGFTMLFAGSTLIMYCWAARWYGPWAGFYAALFLNLSGYHALTGGFALPDGPFLFFALVTMWALGEAVLAEPGRIWPWVWVGLGFGGGLLSKYHGVFLPAAAVLYALVTPGARRLLWSPGPYLAVAIGFAVFSPVLVWNAQNGWASFVFQGGRAVGHEFDPNGLFAIFLGPVGYLLPWIWGLLAWQLVKRLWRFRSLQGIDRLALCLAVVPIAFFTAVSCTRWVLLHWPLIGFVALMPLLGAAWADWAAAAPSWSRRRIALMAAAVLVTATACGGQARFGLIPFPDKDPMEDMSGWDSVAAELDARGLTAEPHTFLTTRCWSDSGQLAFNLRERVPVLCYDPRDPRGFAFWSRPEEWLGWNGLLVVASDEPFDAKFMEPFFRRVELAAEFPMTRAGNPFRAVRVYRCIDQVHPVPFDIPARSVSETNGMPR